MRIDCHVHIIGDGSSGSGCFLSLSHTYHRFLAQIIIRQLGLPSSCLSSGLDEAYSSKVLEFVSLSSLDKAVILAHELPYDDSGRPLPEKASFFTPNSFVLKLASANPTLIPAISIHPARADAIDELDSCVELGAKMLKLLPNCQNVECSKYTKFWERLSYHKLPFLAHTGGELSVPEINPKFADPRNLIHPLECGVTVIAAHGGTRALLWDPSYLGTIFHMLERYPNLYVDNSGMCTPLRSRYFRDLLTIQDRVVHGSDLPIPISAFWPMIWGQVKANDWLRTRRTGNLLERDFQIKLALGFKEESFTRLSSLLPQKLA